MFPGGGIEHGESAETCVRREMREETHLDVAVERLLFDDVIPQPDFYQRRRTYLCRIVSGDAQPGHEPGLEARDGYGMLGSSTQITRPANIAGVPQSQTPDNADAASLARERRTENTRSIASRLIAALGGGVIMLVAAYVLGAIAMRQ